MELCVEKKDLLCRACLCFLIDEDFSNIFEDKELYRNYAGCTSLQVDQNDEYPKNICSSCCEQLSIFFDFKQMCCDTLGRYKDFLKKSDNEIFEDNDILLLNEVLEQSKNNNNDNKQIILYQEKYQVEDNTKQNNVNLGPDFEGSSNSCVINQVPEENCTRVFKDSECLVNNEAVLTDKIQSITSSGQVENGMNLNKVNVENEIILNEVNGVDDKSFSNTDKHSELIVLNVNFVNETVVTEESPIEHSTTIIYAENIQECVECVTSTQDDGKNSLEAIEDENSTSQTHCDSSTTEEQEQELSNDLITSDHVQTKTSPRNTKGSNSRYFCKLCPEKFRKEERYQAHLRIHKGLKAYACEHCDKEFSRNVSLYAHIKRHHLETHVTHSCPHEGCTRTYNRKESLNIHITESHTTTTTTPTKNHMCEICGKAFSRKMFLNRHRYVHIDRSLLPFECNQCGKRFSKKLNLNYHLNRHAGIKNFVCSYCGIQKTTKSELKAHMNFHTLERRWTCPHCDKIFNTLGNIKLHMRTVHEGIRDYKCSYCDRTFGKANTLRCHEMRHTGERPHQCKLCGRGFIQAVALRSHMKTHDKKEKKLAENKIVLKMLEY